MIKPIVSKIKSFTIMETVVVMMVSALVISIAYKAFDIILLNYIRFKQSNQMVADIYRLEKLLTLDFQRCQIIEKKGNDFTFNYENRKIKYQFTEGSILRSQQDYVDTFDMKATNIQAHFLNKPVKNSGIIDELLFCTFQKEDTLNFNFNKEYGADALMLNDSVNISTSL